MQRSKIPQRTPLIILGIWILQMISIFLPFRVVISNYKFFPRGSAELGFEQSTLIFFFLASLFMLIAQNYGQKKWFVLSILTSIVFVWPSYLSFFVEEISFSTWGQAFAPLLGAYIYLLGIFLNGCLLIYWWGRDRELTAEHVSLSPIDWRILVLSVFIFFISSITQSHSINYVLKDFFPFLTPIIVIIERPIMIIFITFIGQFMSGLWLISNYNQSQIFFRKTGYLYFTKIGLLWFMLGFIVSSLNLYEDTESFFYNALGAFLGTAIFLFFEIFTWLVVVNIHLSIKTSFQDLKRNFGLINDSVMIKFKKLFSVPEVRFGTVLFLGYVLGAYLIQNELLAPLFYFWRTSEIMSNTIIILTSIIWVFLAQILSLNNVPAEKISSITRNNLILFVIAHQLNLWERYYVNWMPLEDSFLDHLVIYFQSVLLWRITEFIIIFGLIYFLSFILQKKISIKLVNG